MLVKVHYVKYQALVPAKNSHIKVCYQRVYWIND